MKPWEGISGDLGREVNSMSRFTQLVTAGEDSTVRFWDLHPAFPQPLLRHSWSMHQPVRDMCFFTKNEMLCQHVQGLRIVCSVRELKFVCVC